ncbi:BAAT/acyl-CoA thioester hydrolase protein, partial [Teladorsagia circumcincta]
KPINWLKRQSFTTNRLGIQGVSFGATIVLVLATRFPQAAVDDLAAPSLFCGRYVTKKLKDIGRKVEIQLVNGGHFMEPPYFPHHGAVYAKFQGFCCGYGGDAVLHGKSQEVSWQDTIDFFRTKNRGAGPYA